MTVVRWNPRTELSSLHSQMDRLFNDSLGEVTARLTSQYSTLPVDINQTDDEFTIVASVPEFKPEARRGGSDVRRGVLTIRGHHEEGVDANDAQWVPRERRMSFAYRQLALPAEVQVDKILAGFENGVLTITVPRAKGATEAHPGRSDVDAHPPHPRCPKGWQAKLIPGPTRAGRQI